MIVIILFVLSILAFIIFHLIDRNTTFSIEDYVGFYLINCLICVVTGAVIVCGVANYLALNGTHAKNIQTYESLIYKQEHGDVIDDLGLLKKEYLDEVQAWNEEYAAYKANSENWAISFFFPKKAIEGVDLISIGGNNE